MSKKKFKRAASISWASKKQIKAFVDEVTTAWEQAGLTEAEVLSRVTLILDDAYNGDLKLDESNVHVTGLAIALRNAGCPLPEREGSTTVTKSSAASKYC